MISFHYVCVKLEGTVSLVVQKLKYFQGFHKAWKKEGVKATFVIDCASILDASELSPSKRKVNLQL